MKCNVSALTAKQKKQAIEAGMNIIRERLPEVIENVEAIILWQLHEQYGFGKERLLKFFNATAPMINGMLEYYNYQSDEDAIWVCKHKLKEIGINIDDMVSPLKTDIQLRK